MFSILTNINKIWNIEIGVYVMFKVKYGVNIMHSIIFSHQVGWFDDKGIDIYPWGLKIKPCKGQSCGLWWYVDCIYPT
jgi:hypothetical protein